jgi:hypothetical protein
MKHKRNANPNSIHALTADEIKTLRKDVSSQSNINKSSLSKQKAKQLRSVANGASYVEEVYIEDQDDDIIINTVQTKDSPSISVVMNHNHKTPPVDFRPKQENFEPAIYDSIIPKYSIGNQLIDKEINKISRSSRGSRYSGDSEYDDEDEGEDTYNNNHKRADDFFTLSEQKTTSPAGQDDDNNLFMSTKISTQDTYNNDNIQSSKINEINNNSFGNSTFSFSNSPSNTNTNTVHPDPNSPGKISANNRKVETTTYGSKLITYRNGTTKEIKPDGSVEVRFTNGLNLKNIV